MADPAASPLDPPARPLRRPSLRAQIALVFGALVAVLALLLSLAFGELLRQRIQRDAGTALHAVAGNAAHLLAAGLFDNSRLVQVLAGSPDLWARGLDAPEVIALLQRSQALRSHQVWIGVADAAGIVRASSGNLLRGHDVKERPWFQAGLQDLYVGDVHPAKLLSDLLSARPPDEPQRFMDFAAPIRVGPQTVGVLGIHVGWDWARETVEGLLSPFAAQQQIALFVFDRQGQVIYAPAGQLEAFRAQGQTLPLAAVHPDADSPHHHASAVVAWKDGQNYLTAVTRLQPQNAASDLGWQIVARQPVQAAFAEARDAATLALGLGVAVALAAAGLAWFVARRLSEDLNALASAASAVEAGRPGATIPLATSNREVYRLSSSLISMTQRLLRMNEEMEAQVRRRTLELQKANQELDRQARSDPLTGLLNRRGFGAQMQFALALARRGGRPLSLIALDADHFKRINDRYGHDVGDQVLRSLARRLTARLRESDVVARMGGEEFLVLLPDTDLAMAQRIADELVHTIASEPEPEVGPITVSAGVSTLRPDAEGADTLIRRVDEALYAAKAAGRNQARTLA